MAVLSDLRPGVVRFTRALLLGTSTGGAVRRATSTRDLPSRSCFQEVRLVGVIGILDQIQ